jgi:drug/metabolite transporter (DMT)-like permease
LLLCWYFIDEKIVSDISQTSVISIGYLAMIGYLVGFVTFFHIHRHLDIHMMSLIPMITSVIALWIGQVFVGEELTQTTMIGLCFIIFGLILYEGKSRPQIIKLCQTRWTLLKRK